MYSRSKKSTIVPHTICYKTKVTQGGLEELGEKLSILKFWCISPSTKSLDVVIFISIVAVEKNVCSVTILKIIVCAFPRGDYRQEASCAGRCGSGISSFFQRSRSLNVTKIRVSSESYSVVIILFRPKLIAQKCGGYLPLQITHSIANNEWLGG